MSEPNDYYSFEIDIDDILKLSENYFTLSHKNNIVCCLLKKFLTIFTIKHYPVNLYMYLEIIFISISYHV
jgi:hypothetical protein